ncbi:O-linked N-acetylglucosamine transferase, SPINDLY family protein [Rhizobium alvei]|uniref:Glycosyl transferase n=1 Tax=Rhizobium alvei TaxID=1132659 RepID=A0ABT8YHV6_9HYPH|nr:glycosyl transferase [Rhizobium alvei]MDO6963252.1 glycosyl transferase [Rhizobium alvei]
MGEFLEQAQNAFDRQDWDATFHALNAAMQSDEARDPSVFALLGKTLERHGMVSEAADAFETAASLDKDGGFAHLKAAALAGQTAGLNDRALSIAIRANRLDPADADLIFLIANALHQRGETELLAHFRNRLTASDVAEHLLLARELIGHENRNPYNLVLHRKLADLFPDDPFIRFRLMAIAREFCDFATIEACETWQALCLSDGREDVFAAETPYANLLHIADERLNRLATNNRDLKAPPRPAAIEERRTRRHIWQDRIRIGYLSGDFASTHATMRLLRRVLEIHDRDRFDITLYCYTPAELVAADDGGRSQWGRIVPIGHLNDQEAARQIRADGIDILVDLKGHTGGSRCQILNLGPAPLQMAWLGFPGSTVNVDLDYVIGDRVVLPETARPFYHEKFLRLPHSYQPNDPIHRPRSPAMVRHALGLPENSFIFASFNAQRKITPETFALWMTILARVPNSVLWAMVEGRPARCNLTDRAAGFGIEPERLIFAENADYADHIGRLQAADLGLDTFPYNGHTTTSDMLWAGLPVVTRRGTNFASRVSESLLNAVGLPQLVAETEAAMIELAVGLASQKTMLAEMRDRLISTRDQAPLFDAETFCRYLESGYLLAYECRRKGLAPIDLDVALTMRG